MMLRKILILNDLNVFYWFTMLLFFYIAGIPCA